MKRNSWKTLLSVVLLLTMLMSMLPFAAFAEDGQTAAAQTEEAAKTDEKTGDAPAGGTGGTPKDEGKADDAPKDEPNDANDDAARDENKDAHNGDTEQPAKGEAEGAAQAGTLQAQNEIKLLANPSATLIYNANGGTGADYIYEKSGESGAAEVFFKAERIERFTPPKDKEFSHWNTDPDGKGTTYNVGDLIIVRGGESQTLYAQWEPTPKTPYWAGLTISMSVAPANPKLNEPFTYTVTVTNGTGFDLRNVIVEDTLPANVSAEPGTSDDWTFALSKNPSVKGVSFNDTLTAGSEASFNITAKFETGSVTTAINTAKIVSADYENSGLVGSPTASATATLSGIDWSKLTIEKKVDKDTALPGEKLNYTITVTNNTGCDLSYICVEDTFPSCIQAFYGTGSNVKWKYTTRSDSIEAKLQDGLKAGTNAFFSVEVTLTNNASGTAVNTAQITEAKSEHYTMPSGAGNSATATTSIERAPGSDLPGLTISVTPNTSIADINQKFTYTVEITNNTGKHLKIVRVSNDLPTGVERLGNRAVEGSWNLNTNSSTAILSANLIGNKGLPDGTSASYNVNAKFVSYETATTATNKADIYEVRIGNDITSGNFGTAYAEVYSLKNLTIKKTVDKSTAKPGDTLTYTVEVTNNTDTDLDEVYVEDSLPGTLAYTGSTLVDGATGTLSHDSQLGTVTAKVTGLKKGAAAKYTVTAKVNADASGEISSLAKITKAVRGTDTADITTTKEASAKTTVYTPVPVNVKVLFNGLEDVSQVPAGYKLTGADGNAFLKGEIGLLPAAKDNGVISRTFATTVDVLLGQEYSLSFTQSGYEADGYDCTPEASYTVRQTPTAGSKAINVEITLNYTKAEPKPVEMDAAVTVRFVGLDKDTKLPAGYALIGAPSNEFLSGAITLTKDETADTAVYTGKIQAVPGKAYDLKFAQTGFNVDGYKCDATAAVSKTVTADAKKGVEVTITLNYTKTDAEKTEMPVAVNVKFVGLDKDTKLPAYTLTGAPTNEFLSGAITLTKDETADTMTYTGKIQAVPGKAYGLSFIQSGFDVAGFICDASVVVTKNVTADAKTGVVVDLVLTYTKINWGGLTITKTADKTYATPGSYVKYTITVTNNTGVDLTNVNVLDYLPSTVRYSSSFGGYNSGTSSWTIAKLADGKSATTTIRVKLNSGLSTGTAIENTAYVTGVTINGQEHVFENLLLNSTAKVIVTDGKGAPQTGDESNLGLWGAVMAASLVCAGAAAVIYKKRRG